MSQQIYDPTNCAYDAPECRFVLSRILNEYQTYMGSENLKFFNEKVELEILRVGRFEAFEVISRSKSDGNPFHLFYDEDRLITYICKNAMCMQSLTAPMEFFFGNYGHRSCAPFKGLLEAVQEGTVKFRPDLYTGEPRPIHIPKKEPVKRHHAELAKLYYDDDSLILEEYNEQFDYWVVQSGPACLYPHVSYRLLKDEDYIFTKKCDNLEISFGIVLDSTVQRPQQNAIDIIKEPTIVITSTKKD